jgi:hypothetical protein
MNLILEKEKIKKEIDLIGDVHIIQAIKKLLAGYDTEEGSSLSMVKEPPIEDWEMATPLGRTPTPEQLEEWLDKDEGESMPAKKALAYMKKTLADRRKKRKSGNES